MTVRHLSVGTLAAPTPTQCGAVRFRKDILRTGTYYVDGRKWTVTGNTLRQLASSHLCIREAGNHIPLVWDHSESARDRIGEVEGLSTDGHTLWAVVKVLDCEAIEKLSNISHEVSVEVREPWQDGRGNNYALALTHLGVVNLPVVAGQGDFKRLSLQKGEAPMRPMSKHLALQHSKLLASHIKAIARAKERVRHFSTITGEVPTSEAVSMLNHTLRALKDRGLSVFAFSNNHSIEAVRNHWLVIKRFILESNLAESEPGDRGQKSGQAAELEKSIGGENINATGGKLPKAINASLRRCATSTIGAVPADELRDMLNLLFQCSPVLRPLAFPRGITSDELRMQWTPVKQVLDDMLGISQAGGTPGEFLDIGNISRPDYVQMSLGGNKSAAVEARQEQLRKTVFKI